jgi:RNA polymerase sigma-70 factor (ECF subfamily)
MAKRLSTAIPSNLFLIPHPILLARAIAKADTESGSGLTASSWGSSMSDTSASLLERLRRQPDGESWKRLVDLYTPLLRGWLRRNLVPPDDADDLVQEVMTVLVRELPQFQYDRRCGSFRAWLRTITVNRLRMFWRSRRSRPLATGASDLARKLDELEDPHSALSRLWDHDHDRHVAHRLLQLIEPEFEAATWRAFQRVALDGATPAAVAAELGISPNAVYLAKYRVLHRLRQEMQGLTD